MPDAADYGDVGSDTLGNIARHRPLELPNLCSLGLGNLKPGVGLPADFHPTGSYGRCALCSPGKDTTTGHWEIAGIHLERPFPLFPNGFPEEFLRSWTVRTGRSYLGNKAASGTEILKELGDEHVRTGSPIIYTSADSVFQVAAHEEVIPLWELYKICEAARALLRGPWEVARVIARPFIGSAGSFHRTPNRRDFAISPPRGMLLDRLDETQVAVHGVGKISDVFAGRGIRTHVSTCSNEDGMQKTLEALAEVPEGLIFTNLVDFDQSYGHRNDVEGYAHALEQFDRWLPRLQANLFHGDLLLITADHGCDPTTSSTDHTREYVPLLSWSPSRSGGVDLGTRSTLSDIGQTIAENFGTTIFKGVSFLRAL